VISFPLFDAFFRERTPLLFQEGSSLTKGGVKYVDASRGALSLPGDDHILLADAPVIDVVQDRE
jgi:hypothetical protein